jgi:subtilisin-like proprotein convertase family protein
LNGRNNNSLAIPDDNPQGITSPIQVPQTGSVRDIQIGVNIEHSFLGDIEVSLIPPTGQTVLLQGRTLVLQPSCKAPTRCKTHPALKQLLASPAAGVWHLLVVDYAQLDTGTVKSWELTLGI